MPRFAYRAVGADGATVQGEIEARDQAETIDRLLAKGLTPMWTGPVRSAGIRGWRWPGRRSGLPLRELTIFTQELNALLSAGVVLERALAMLSGTASAPRAAVLARDLLQQVRGGASLSAALEAQGTVFPRYYVSLVRAGETGGALGPVLRSLAEQLDRSLFIQGRIRSALTYPVFLTLMIGFCLVIIFAVVLPRFEDLFDSAEGRLPLATAAMLALRSVLAQWWWALVLFTGASVFAVVRLLGVPAVRLAVDRKLLTSPLLLGLVQKAEGGRFARLMGTLAGRGVSLPQALELAAGSLSNRALAQGVSEAAAKVKRGQALAPSLAATGLLPGLVPQLIAVGEETGKLSPMALKAAGILERDVQHTIERLLALLTPVMTVVMGGIVALVVGSMVLGLMSIHEFAL